MRTIDTHKVNQANDRLAIRVTDEPSFGGANHVYSVEVEEAPMGADPLGVISFQKGPIAEHGVNGLTHEVLLAIVIDRLRSFQAGDFSCRENALALTKLEEAQHWLQHRTKERMARGVEGRNVA